MTTEHQTQHQDRDAERTVPGRLAIATHSCLVSGHRIVWEAATVALLIWIALTPLKDPATVATERSFLELMAWCGFIIAGVAPVFASLGGGFGLPFWDRIAPRFLLTSVFRVFAAPFLVSGWLVLVTFLHGSPVFCVLVGLVLTASGVLLRKRDVQILGRLHELGDAPGVLGGPSTPLGFAVRKQQHDEQQEPEQGIDFPKET